MYFGVVFHPQNSISHAHTPQVFREWPTVEALEVFVEKRIEYGEPMNDHAADLDAVIEKQLGVVEALERNAKLAEEPSMRRGKAGQTSTDILADLPGPQKSCKFRRRGDSKIMPLHRRHACTSDCHDSISFFPRDIPAKPSP